MEIWMNQIINISEWQSVFVENVYLSRPLGDLEAKKLTQMGVLEIEELKDGLRVTSNSFVGKVILDTIEINIAPKLQGMPLYKLMRYAYNLSDLHLFDSANHSISEFTFFDLLIYQLLVEVESLLCRGVQKHYIRVQEPLSSPRGRIDFNHIARKGGVLESKLMCTHYQRSSNYLLNKTLLAGLVMALQLAKDHNLKNDLNRLIAILSDEIETIHLTRAVLKKTYTSVSRLDERYLPILEIINIIYESQGLAFETQNKDVALRGYLFDMNVFFEALVGKLLKDTAQPYDVKEQYSLKQLFKYTPNHNPLKRKSPTPRPDFALMDKGKAVRLLDAKYRNLWDKSLPREMLYQLAIYALSGVGDKTATILYPCLSDIPCIQKIDISSPITGDEKAWVVLQPINLLEVVDRIDEGRLEEMVL
jgi:5-methylcytosine-specific restriction enzyme subunit McrC